VLSPAEPPQVGNEAIAVRWESASEIDVEHSDRPVGWQDREERTPSSLEAAVIRQISDRTPLPVPAPSHVDANAPSIVDTSGLKARAGGAPAHSAGALPSLPPDAVVPGTPSEENLHAADPVVASASPVPPRPGAAERASSASLEGGTQATARDDATRDETSARARADAAVLEASREASARAWDNAASIAESSGRVVGRPSPDFASRPVNVVPARPAADTSDPPPPPAGTGGGSFGIGLLVALGAMAALGLGLRYGRSRIGEAAPAPIDPQVTTETPFPELPASPPAVSATAVTPGAAPHLAVSATPAGRVQGAPSGVPVSALPVASAPPTMGEDLPLPPGIVVSANQGLLDVETGGKEALFVDGVELGKGPSLRLVLAPGVHEVRQRVRGEWRIRFVLIRPSRRTRLPLSSWIR
jgi:hypothetical protein